METTEKTDKCPVCFEPTEPGLLCDDCANIKEKEADKRDGPQRELTQTEQAEL